MTRPPVLRTVLLGAGKSGSLFAAALLETPRATLLGIAGGTGGSADRLAARSGCRVLGAEPPWSDGEVDLVVIATPHDLHVGQAKAAMGRGAHVLVEKPLALTPADLAELQAVADATGRSVLCGFVQRCTEEMLACRRYLTLRRDRIRGVTATQILRRDLPYYSSWKGDPVRAGGGVLVNQAIHALDLALFLTGALPDTANCVTTTSRGLRVEDGVTATLRTRDGWTLTLTAATYAGVAERQVLRFHLDTETVVVVGTETPRWSVAERDVEDHIALLARAQDTLGPGHRLLLADALAVSTDAAPSRFACDLAGVRATHAALFALYASAGRDGATQRVHR